MRVAVAHVHLPKQPPAAPPEVDREQHDQPAVQRDDGDGHLDSRGARLAAHEGAGAAGAPYLGIRGAADDDVARAASDAVAAEVCEAVAGARVRQDEACRVPAGWAWAEAGDDVVGAWEMTCQRMDWWYVARVYLPEICFS